MKIDWAVLYVRGNSGAPNLLLPSNTYCPLYTVIITSKIGR
jgi:hypothetical protein